MINYFLLGQAIAFYKEVGYTYIEVPWIVSKEAQFATLSDETRAFEVTDKGYLVGSAEQGIIELMKHGLSNGAYVSCSPCFRNEPVKDDLHLDQFMKVELSVISSELRNIDDIVGHALMFKQARSPSMVKTKYISDTEIDLEINGVEVGSYGVREIDGKFLYYGTGLALPRFDQAVHMI